MIKSSGIFRQRAKKLVQTGLHTRMQLRSISEARRGRKQLEAARGSLSKASQCNIRDYAVEVLGWRGYAPWLALYTAAQGGFHPGWLPDNYYQRVAGPLVNGEYHHIARHRACNGIAFDGSGFADIAYSVNGIFYDTSYGVIAPDDLNQFFQDRAKQLVFKADSSGLGLGLAFFDAAEATPEALHPLGNGVLQNRITPHSFFDQFGLASLATLRLVTAIGADGVASVRGCYLKLGRAGGSHVVANDQVRVAVDWDTGEMAAEGYLSDWRPVVKHPDTGQPWGGQKIPCIAACVQTVLKLHAQNTLPRLLCWDVAIDTLGDVQVLEWEGGVVSFAEATQGPCFADLGWDRLHLDGARS